MSKDFLTNIKPRFSIYPPMCPPFLISSFFYPVAVTCWSLLAWRRPPFAAVCSPFSPGVPSAP